MKTTQSKLLICFDMAHADNPAQSVSEDITPTLLNRVGTGGNQVPVLLLERKPHGVISYGHDERSCQFTEGITDPLTASDYKQPTIIAYERR